MDLSFQTDFHTIKSRPQETHHLTSTTLGPICLLVCQQSTHHVKATSKLTPPASTPMLIDTMRELTGGLEQNQDGDTSRTHLFASSTHIIRSG
eukprot:scaffold9865_cov58-Cyclotella_meneghiniana.AAC.2